MPAERRRHERKSVDLDAVFQAPGGERQAARLTDLSLGGAFIQTDDPPAFGATIAVFVTFPGSTRETEIGCTVRWRHGDGVGVQFGMLRARDTYALTEYLAKEAKMAKEAKEANEAQ